MPIYVVMNRCQTKRSGRQALSRFNQVVSQFLHTEVSEMGMLPEDKIVTRAVMRQTPYILLDESAPISKAVKQITNNYLSNKPYQVHQPLSFIQRLKQLLKER